MDEKPLCYFCGREMLWFVETLMCPECNKIELFILKYDHMEQRKRKEMKE